MGRAPPARGARALGDPAEAISQSQSTPRDLFTRAGSSVRGVPGTNPRRKTRESLGSAYLASDALPGTSNPYCTNGSLSVVLESSPRRLGLQRFHQLLVRVLPL